jgi:hypothetical protein
LAGGGGHDDGMRRDEAVGLRAVIWITVASVGLVLGAVRAETAGTGASRPLDQLIERLNAGAPVPDGATIGGWVENGPEGAELVVRIEPQGAIKLIADPGITITPTARPGVAWLTELPYRRVDPAIEYFTPPATLRLPFTASDGQPIELLVEYAYCVVDFQCFFAEETLTVAIDGS